MMRIAERERVVEVSDERDPLAGEALGLIVESFPPYDRHSLEDLRSEVAEKRLGLLDPYDFHLLTLLDPEGRPLATATGVYLAGVNAGFVTYLAVRPEQRGRHLGRRVRSGLVDAFRADARRHGRSELAWTVGEVRMESSWLLGLVRHGGAIPFDFTYYHPGMLPGGNSRYVLYREPFGDRRAEIPAAEVRRVVYAIWRRGYRVRYPLEHPAFAAMMAELDGRETVGAHPDVARKAAKRRESGI